MSRAVSLDAMGTLVRVRGGHVGRAYSTQLRSQRGSGATLRSMQAVHADAVQEAFTPAFRAVSSQWQAAGEVAGGTTPDLARRFWLQVLGATFSATGVAATDSLEAADVFNALFDHFGTGAPYECLPEAAECMAVLREHPAVRYRCVVTNFDGRIHTILHDLGLRGFDAVYSLQEAAARKPDPAGLLRAAAHAERVTGCSQLRWTHVGDCEADEVAAAAVAAAFVRCDRSAGVASRALLAALAD